MRTLVTLKDTNDPKDTVLNVDTDYRGAYLRLRYVGEGRDNYGQTEHGRIHLSAAELRKLAHAALLAAEEEEEGE